MRPAGLTLLVCAVATPMIASADPEHEPFLSSRREIEGRVGEGELLPWMIGARHAQRGVLVGVFGGRDTTTDTTVLSSLAQATIFDRVAVRATFANDGYDADVRPTAGLVVDALRQDAHGVDLAVSADYAPRGYNTVPAVITRVAVARHVGPTTLLANIELGLGIQEGERYTAMSLGLVRELARGWSVGLSSQAHLDLERDDDEPVGERDHDLQAGPVATYALGPFAVTALVGVSAWQLRRAPDTHVGAVALLGAAALF